MTILLIVANIVVFVLQWARPSSTIAWALIPVRLMGVHPDGIIPPLTTLLTSQFLHGGVVHLAGNMLFLWIFGNNVEDEMGPFRFLLFYLLCGTAAGLVHSFSQPTSAIPTVGASGAISGVLGAYAILFPRARIHTLVFLILYVTVLPIPALLWVGVWFAVQVLQGLAARGVAGAGGVAWFAHVGGAIAGTVLVLLFRRRRRGIRRLGPFTDYEGP